MRRLLGRGVLEEYRERRREKVLDYELGFFEGALAMKE
jgi:hypothetical protein